MLVFSLPLKWVKNKFVAVQINFVISGYSEKVEIHITSVFLGFQQPEFQNERLLYAWPRLNTSLGARKYNLLITFKVLRLFLHVF